MNRIILLVTTIYVACQVTEGKEQPPVFVEEPIDVSVREGEDVLLRCKITGNGSRCQWARGGEAIQIGKGSMYQYASDKDRGDCSLRISRTSRQDENLWSCQLQTPLGTFTSRTAQISLIVPPEPPIIRFMGEVVRSEHPIEVLYSYEVHFECISRKGKPASTLDWIIQYPLHNIQKFIQQSADDPHLQDSIIIWNTVALFIPSQYSILCIAHHPGYNNALTTRAEIYVPSQRKYSEKLVPIPQIFTYHPTSVIVEEGDEILLECKSSRNNASGCQWMRGGHLMDFTQYPTYQYTNRVSNGTCSLSIFQTTRADETLWSCHIPTPYKHISKYVQVSFIIKPYPPTFRFQNQDLLPRQTIVVNQSQPFLIECVSRKGKPPAFLEWIVDMNESTGTIQSFTQLNSEDPRLQDSIIILNTQGWSEPGNYTVQCASNHPTYRRVNIFNVTLTVTPLKILSDIGVSVDASEEPGLLKNKDFTDAEENPGSKTDLVTTIAIAVPVITLTVIVIVIGIHIELRRSHTTSTETEVQIAYFHKYLDVLPDVSKEELSNRPPLPLPRGSQIPELQDDDGDFGDKYETIDDLTMPRGMNSDDYQVSPLTESLEFGCNRVPSTENIADDSQTSPL